jgi:20S proteasome subunit beta 4
MEYVMGIKGKDFVMLCTSATAVQQIITMKDDEDKIVPLDTHTVLACSGEPGDRVQFSEFVAANVRLYALRNGSKLSTKAIANFARGELATALRKGPKSTNLLVAGYDEGKGPSLYFLDYLATMHKMNVAGYGYGSWFVLSMYDRLWHPDLTEEEAIKMMKLGLEEVKRRLVVASSSYTIKVVNKDGIKIINL